MASLLDSLEDGPLLGLSHGKPAAVLVEPEQFRNLIERIEQLEYLLDGRQAVADYKENPGTAVDAEEVFERIS